MRKQQSSLTLGMTVAGGSDSFPSEWRATAPFAQDDGRPATSVHDCGQRTSE